MSICNLNVSFVENEADSSLVRPPGAVRLSEFAENCVKCGDCVEDCPGQVLKLDYQGYPYLADILACGKCGLCADICMHRAI